MEIKQLIENTIVEFVSDQNDQFWLWFGDSVLIENGQPLIVYHGTDSKFSEFSRSKAKEGRIGKGFYFSTDQDEARVYGSIIIPCYLKIDNLFNGRTRESIGNGDNFGVEYALTRDGGRVFLVDNPLQIKSVNNDGSWDADDANIYSIYNIYFQNLLLRHQHN